MTNGLDADSHGHVCWVLRSKTQKKTQVTGLGNNTCLVHHMTCFKKKCCTHPGSTLGRAFLYKSTHSHYTGGVSRPSVSRQQLFIPPPPLPHPPISHRTSSSFFILFSVGSISNNLLPGVSSLGINEIIGLTRKDLYGALSGWSPNQACSNSSLLLPLPPPNKLTGLATKALTAPFPLCAAPRGHPLRHNSTIQVGGILLRFLLAAAAPPP